MKAKHEQLSNGVTKLIMSSLYWLFAFSYVFAAMFTNYPLDFMHKALPALLLAGWLHHLKLRHGYVAISAMLFCAAGDIFLKLPLAHGFVAGLSAFLIGHLLFACFFYQWAVWLPRKLIALVALIAVMLGIGALILPQTGQLLWPVSAYFLVITAMAITAIIATKKSLLLAGGALTFMLSDVMIGVNKFIMPVPFEHLLIMLSYYLALYLLAIGIKQRNKET